MSVTFVYCATLLDGSRCHLVQLPPSHPQKGHSPSHTERDTAGHHFFRPISVVARRSPINWWVSCVFIHCCRLINQHCEPNVQSATGTLEFIHCMSIYIGWPWRNFFISAVFCHFVGQALQNVCYSDVSRHHFLNKIAIVRTQFYSNNATSLHHLTTHSTTYWPTKWRSHCDHRYVASLHRCIFYCLQNVYLKLV